jgi:choline dehydrogenase-like flavoprotein
LSSQNGEYIPAAHSSSGLLGISLPDWDNSLDGRVIKATKELSAEFPFQQDMNAGNPIGVGWTQSSVLDGVRTDSNSAYISKFLSRPNLTVLTNAQVTKVLKTGTTNGLPVFRGVEFALNTTGKATQRGLISAS